MDFSNASASFKKRNPHLFGVGAVAGAQPQPGALETLVRCRAPRPKRAACLVRISLVAYRRRLLDDDNNVASFKFLRDAIAKAIGLDDGDKRIAFECAQIETRGEEGTSVKIELL